MALGPPTQVTVAEVQPLADPAAPLEVGLAVLQHPHHRIAGIGPDFGEGALANVPQGVVPGELVDVEVPQRIDAGDGDPRLVPAIPAQHLMDFLRPLGVLLLHPHIEVDVIGVVVHREDVLLDAPCVEVLGAVEDVVYHRPCLAGLQVEAAHLIPSAGVGEVIDAEAGDSLLLRQVEYAWHLIDIHCVDGEAQADGDACILAVADALQGLLEGPLLAPDLVVRCPHAVQADPHVREACLLDPLCHLGGDQGAVGREDAANSFGHGVGRQVEQVLSHEGLAAREEEDGHPEVGQVVDQPLALGRGHLP